MSVQARPRVQQLERCESCSLCPVLLHGDLSAKSISNNDDKSTAQCASPLSLLFLSATLHSLWNIVSDFVPRVLSKDPT